MKKILFLLLISAGALTSCVKNNDNVITFDPVKQAAIDSVAIKTYLTAHPEITPVKDTLGVKYQVITAGTGTYPTDASSITVDYSGSLLNGTVFDSSTGYSQILGNLIAGWRIVLPHVRGGSKVLMIIPSRFGYGNAANGAIPANSVLIFTITLKSNNGGA